MIQVVQTLTILQSFLMEHLLVLNFILAIVIVFFQRKEPKAVWAWIIILYALPIIGFFFYLLVGTDTRKRKIFKTKEITDRFQEAIKGQELVIQSKEIELTNPNMREYSDLVYYNLESSSAIFSADNSVEHIVDGREKFHRLMEDVKNAKDYIHMEYYIIKDDVLFREIEKILIQKAQEGVEVRILFDAMGSQTMTNRYRKRLHQNGIQTAVFFKAVLGKLHLRMNYRNHRKIVVIDGEIGYVGGFNIGKEYVSLDQKIGYWRDTHIRIEGTVVLELGIRFILDWNYANHEDLFQVPKYTVLPTRTFGASELQVISSGPDSTLKNIRNNYLRLIAKAKEDIYIQTPYFIPDEEILSALIIALHSGVRVHLMIPCKPDHPFVYWATYSYVGELVLNGANCYTYENGFLHAKGMIVDSKVYCYGTANMDIRSFQLNFEVNVVNYTREDALHMTQLFQTDIANCKRITKEDYRKRGLIVRFKEQFCRLFSPLL
ncbi:MAG: cardiolipin synthase [Eubacteriales bacterium]